MYRWEHRATQYHKTQVFEQFEFHKQERFSVWEENYAIARKARQKALQMLDFPLHKKTITERYPDGREKTIVIEPANWSVKDALIIAEKAGSILQDVNKNFDADLMIEFLEKMGFKVVDPSIATDSIEVENLLKEAEEPTHE